MPVDGWFPRLAPDALHLACGSATITVATLDPLTGAITAEQALGTGIYPTWASASRVVWGNRADGSAGRVRMSDSPFTSADDFSGTPLVVSTIDAGGGIVGVYTAAAPTVTTRILNASGSVIATLPSQALPTVDTDGRYATLAHSDDAITVSTVGRVVAESAIATPRIGTTGLVWSKLANPRRTHGWRGSGIEDVSIFPVHEFLPLVVDTPAGPWIALFTEQGSNPGLYVHPWGNSAAVLLAAGGSDQIFYPHVVYHSGSGRFVAAWTTGPTLKTTSVAVDILDPTYAIGSGTAISPGASGLPPTATSITPTQKQRDAARLVGAQAPRPDYPHVDEIEHLPTQKTLRIIYDRLFHLSEQLNGARPSGLKTATDAVSSNLSSFQTAQTLQLQQLTAASTGAPIVANPIPSGGGSGSSGGSGGGGGGGGGTPGPDIGNHLATVQAERVTYDAYSGVERAGRITNAVAWDLRNLGVGVVSKTSGTNWHGWSIDVIMVNPGGAAYDILFDAEGVATPTWNRKANDIDVSRWQAPVDPASI